MFDAETMCGAHKRRNRTGCEAPDMSKCSEPGHLCQRSKGYGTDHKGVGKCKYHGGTSPNGQKFAAKEAAANALEMLGIPIPTDPVAALQSALDSANGVHAAIEKLLREAAADQGDMKAIGVRLGLYGESIDRLARVAKLTVEANLDTRRAQLATAQAALMVEILRRALSRAGVDPAIRASVERALGIELRAHVAELPGGAA